MDIFVRNLATNVTENDLRELFEDYGSVSSISMLKKYDSSAPLGFAFISMPAECQAMSAINALKGVKLKGQTMEFNDLGLRFERRRKLKGRSHECPESERRASRTNEY